MSSPFTGHLPHQIRFLISLIHGGCPEKLTEDPAFPGTWKVSFLLSTEFSAPTGEQLQLRFKAILSLALLVYTDLRKCSPEASKT